MNLDKQKKTEKIQLRTTEHLKAKVEGFSLLDGISQNSIINQALAWYVEERERRVA